MGKLKVSLCVLFLLTFTASMASAEDINLTYWGLSVDGTIYSPANPFPSGAFVGNLLTAGLGSLYGDFGPGAHQVLGYFDYDIINAANNNTVNNEYGNTNGTPGAGMSWMLDDPSLVIPAFLAGLPLPDTNGVPQANAVIDPNDHFNDCCDVAVAIGWDFTVNAGDTYRVTFLAGNNPPAGFYLQQTDLSSNDNIFLNSTLGPAGPTIPEPGSILLLGTVLSLLAFRVARKRA